MDGSDTPGLQSRVGLIKVPVSSHVYVLLPPMSEKPSAHFTTHMMSNMLYHARCPYIHMYVWNFSMPSNEFGKEWAENH